MERHSGKSFIDEIAAQKGIPREEVLEEMAMRIRARQAKAKELAVNDEGKFRVIGELEDEHWVVGEFGTEEEASEFAIRKTFFPDQPNDVQIDKHWEAKVFLQKEKRDPSQPFIAYNAYAPDGRFIGWYPSSRKEI